MSTQFVQARLPHVDDRVRLLDSIPETSLCRGQVGVVCSTWASRGRPVFEVEFHSIDESDISRRLLTADQIEVDEEVSKSV
jgi:hypothetical protein